MGDRKTKDTMFYGPRSELMAPSLQIFGAYF